MSLAASAAAIPPSVAIDVPSSYQQSESPHDATRGGSTSTDTSSASSAPDVKVRSMPVTIRPRAPGEKPLRRSATGIVREIEHDSWTAKPIVPPAEIHPDDHEDAWRHRAHALLESHRAHMVIIALVLLDLVLVIVELFVELFSYQGCLDHEPERPGEKYETSHATHVTEEVLHWASVAILSIFVLEVFVKLVVFRLRYYRNLFHAFDALVIFVSFFTTILLHGLAESVLTFFIFLRLWRVFRIIDGVAVAIEDSQGDKMEKLKAKMRAMEVELEQYRSGRLQPASASGGGTKFDNHARDQQQQHETDKVIWHGSRDVVESRSHSQR